VQLSVDLLNLVLSRECVYTLMCVYSCVYTHMCDTQVIANS
jgi:hypothetical protein